jgi:aerobic-type carbon monoxide dehydrogenase small subunit (CoxS/CutS family)
VITVHPAKSGAAYGECLTCTVIINGRETKPKQ